MSLFDVLLPTRGRSHTIGFAIASVLDQTVPDFTLHVAGDGCGEETAEVVRAIGDERVRFVAFPKGMGFGYAHRNAVLRASSAPFVAYMTDDDLLFPDHLERGLGALESGDRLLVALRAAQVRYPDDLDLHFFAYEWGPLSVLLRRWFMGSANLVHRRTLFDRIGWWDETLPRFGDRDFYRRARATGEDAFVDETTVLRFFARQWEGRYAGLLEPPQKKYLARMRDPSWRDAVRAETRAGGRGLGTRWRQAREFGSWAVRSGPRFVRFAASRALPRR